MFSYITKNLFYKAVSLLYLNANLPTNWSELVLTDSDFPQLGIWDKIRQNILQCVLSLSLHPNEQHISFERVKCTFWNDLATLQKLILQKMCVSSEEAVNRKLSWHRVLNRTKKISLVVFQFLIVKHKCPIMCWKRFEYITISYSLQIIRILKETITLLRTTEHY